MELYDKLHEANVIHNDVAPRHIFYTKGARHVVAVDFDSSEDITSHGSSRNWCVAEEDRKVQKMFYYSSCPPSLGAQTM